MTSITIALLPIAPAIISFVQDPSDDSVPYPPPTSWMRRYAWMRKWVRIKYYKVIKSIFSPIVNQVYLPYLGFIQKLTRTEMEACLDLQSERQYLQSALRLRIKVMQQLRRRRPPSSDQRSIRKLQGLPSRLKRRIIANAALAMSSSTTHRNLPARFDTDSMPIGMDNRCSACISDREEHFEDLRPTRSVIRGFGNTKHADIMVGTLVWKVLDDDGKEHTFRIPKSYYVPQAGMRLFSPQHVDRCLRDQRRGSLSETSNSVECVMRWGENEEFTKTIPLDHQTNVFTFDLAPGFSNYFAYCTECNIDDQQDLVEPLAQPATMVSDDENDERESPPTYHREGESSPGVSSNDDDIRPAPTIPEVSPFDLDRLNDRDPGPAIIEEEEDTQKVNHAAQFLKYHHKFNHCSPKKIQEMAKQGQLPKYLATCDVPICSACQFGKATRRKWRDKTRKNRRQVVPPSRPGQVVSVDMMVAGVPGLIPQSAGFLTKKRYTVATVFVDHFSNYSYVHFQKGTTVEETLEAKEAFERLAATHGVSIRNYHADNGTFAARGWIEACHQKRQGITFAGVNAHHQNGRAEARIKHLQDMARTSMIHAAKRWPEAINSHLWPYAVRLANLANNATPWLSDPKKRSPEEMFSGSKVDTNPKHWHHFGCPVFVLDKNMQVGERPKGGKWIDRSRIGIYLGPSPQHSRSVALVLNITTGRVAPEFHITVDSKFHSVKNSTRQERPKVEWMEAAHFTDKEMEKTKKAKSGESQREVRSQGQPPNNQPTQDLPPRESEQLPIEVPEGAPNPPTIDQGQGQQEPDPPAPAPAPEPEPSPAEEPAPAPEADPPRVEQTPLRRSRRQKKNPVRLIEAMNAEIESLDVPFELFALQAMFPNEVEDPIDIFALKASNDPDTMYHHEAMKEPDAKRFMEAMEKEVTDQIDDGVLELIRISDLPKNARLLPAVWQMKRKRDIKTREILKWKARMNIDGSRMVKNRDYDLTYAPVASWGVIKLLLALSLIHNWHTVQLDYVLAFTQAPVERELYMKLPKGITIDGVEDPEGWCFKLHKNTYGQKQAGRVWNQYLKKKLEECGFEQSRVDESVFFKGKMIYVLYTDDSIIAGPDKSEIDATIALMKTKLKLTEEGDLNDFLGVNIERKDGGFWLTQPHLINQILEALRLKKKGEPISKHSKSRSTPMISTKILQKETDSPPFDNHFNYRSVIGKIAYLEKGTRPELAYACHQCSRYSSDPRKVHGEAVKRIGRYLLGTADKGMFIKPDLSRSFEVHVDADFCGNWDRRYGHEPDSARSRHGYVITYAGVPIVHKSQLQTEIALSTTESEYTGLSYALREAIPLMELLKEMKERDFGVLDHSPKVHCRVFEDNSGALEIASVHKFRPRTKHIATKLHHFRSYVTTGEISIHAIDTNNQPADIFTKPLAEDLFIQHRKWLLGW